MDGLIAYALSKKYADEVGQSILDAGFKTQVEQDRSILQTVGQEKILYFIPKTTAKPSDGYDEYVYSNNAWEQVGATDVDLSSYATKAEVGDLDNLPTTDKSSIVSAISETFTSVSNGKSLVASAITDKGVSTSSDATFEIMAQNIEAIPTGSPKPKTVNFYDFKGNLAHSYTAAEAAELTEMPEAPVIEGFTFQKWNWSLASVKTWLTKHENDNCDLSVGGLYVTTDGHTRIYMHLREAELATLEMPFCIQQMAGTVVIDWGDNSNSETITAAGIYSHLWQVNSYPADVMIDIEYVPSGSIKLVLGLVAGGIPYGLFNNETYYASCVEKVEYGTNTDMLIYSATFKNCSKLKSINIPSGFTNISGYAFSGCTNLALTVLPDGITRISGGAFSSCTNLALTVLPDGITRIGENAFRGCTSLYFIDLTAFTDPQAIPTLANVNAFQNIPATAQFIVANQEMYDAFTTATNWSTYASKFVIEGA